jgi:hypothetical protein
MRLTGHRVKRGAVDHLVDFCSIGVIFRSGRGGVSGQYGGADKSAKQCA